MTDAQAETQKRPTWLQGLFIVGAGVLLAIGGCATFVVLSDSEVIAFLGGIAFLVGLLAVVVGGIRFIVGVVKALLSR